MSVAFEAGVGPTARILKGRFQFKESFVFRTIASAFFLTPRRMVETEL